MRIRIIITLICRIHEWTFSNYYIYESCELSRNFFFKFSFYVQILVSNNIIPYLIYTGRGAIHCSQMNFSNQIWHLTYRCCCNDKWKMFEFSDPNNKLATIILRCPILMLSFYLVLSFAYAFEKYKDVWIWKNFYYTFECVGWIVFVKVLLCWYSQLSSSVKIKISFFLWNFQ